LSPKRRKATYLLRATYPERIMGVTNITEANKSQQKRFFCENCHHEVFLQAKYCENCGGEIEWPDEIKNVLATWKKEEKKSH
jgi:hypothetical protein